MNDELKAYFEGGCNAILVAAKYVLNNYNILSSRDIYHDCSGCNTNINSDIEKVLKAYLSPMRVPIFSTDQVNMVYGGTSAKKDLHYWMINPSSNPIESVNRDRNFSISLILMCDQKLLLSIVSVPAENKIYFDSPSEGLFMIEGCRERRFDLSAKYLLSIAKPISMGDRATEDKHPSTHYWLG
ncbi:MAG: hypothetical protein SNH18_04815 [Rikenellaceae bacterium]